MSELTKYKFWGVLLSVLLSLYVLAPTVFGFRARLQEMALSGKTPPWYYGFFPKGELNLGLDLRGGLYVELGVDLNRAQERERDVLISEMLRVAIPEENKTDTLKAVAQDLVRVESSHERIEAIKESLRKNYQMYLETVTGSPEVFFQVKGSLEEAKKAAQKALDEAGRKLHMSAAYKNKYLAFHFNSVEDKQYLVTTLGGEVYKDHLELKEALSGVAYFKIRADYFKAVQSDILLQASNAIRNRIDRFGVAEASVSIQGGDRIIIEVPGVQKNQGKDTHDVDRVIDIVKQTGELSFHLVDDSKDQDEIRKLVHDKIDELKLLQEAGLTDQDLGKLSGDDVPKLFTQENIDRLNEALRAELPENSSLYVEFVRNNEDASQEGKIIGHRIFLLHDHADISGEMIETTNVDKDKGKWVVTLSFNPVGTQIFGDITTKHVNKLFAIVLDGRVMLAPHINEPITSGHAQIELGYGEEAHNEAKKIVLVLKEGALPARLSIESQSIIGPSLGQDAIDAGVKSVLIAAVIVMIFMMVYYKFGGFIANLALVLNVVMIFAIMSLFGASLSLPGIAGIVLTMGMAVDANVIIFERMREEKYRARGPRDVVHSGYSSAMSAILDGNITTFFSGLVLFQFGTGPIKGFATTLMIGIVTTVFTAVVVTQVIYEVLLEKFAMKKVSC